MELSGLSRIGRREKTKPKLFRSLGEFKLRQLWRNVEVSSISILVNYHSQIPRFRDHKSEILGIFPTKFSQVEGMLLGQQNNRSDILYPPPLFHLLTLIIQYSFIRYND